MTATELPKLFCTLRAGRLRCCLDALIQVHLIGSRQVGGDIGAISRNGLCNRECFGKGMVAAKVHEGGNTQPGRQHHVFIAIDSIRVQRVERQQHVTGTAGLRPRRWQTLEVGLHCECAKGLPAIDTHAMQH